MSRSSCSRNGCSCLDCDVLLELLVRQRQDFRPDEAGRFGGVRGGVLVAAQHPLVAAVGHVLGRFQIGIRAEPLAGAIEFAVELEALGERGRAVAERAAELFVLAGSASPTPRTPFPTRRRS